MKKVLSYLALLLFTPVMLLAQTSGLPGPIIYAVATGSVNVLAVTQPGAVLVVGQPVTFLPNLANTTTTPSLAVNGLTAKTITKFGTTALVAGDLTTTAIAVVIYDGTQWELQNPQTATASLPSIAAHTVLGNATGSTATAAATSLGAQDTGPGGYSTTTGLVNVLAATMAPAVTSYVAGLEISILPNLANTTTTPTINLNGLGAKNITKLGTAALVAGDLSTTAVAWMVYDGTQFQLLNPQTSPTPLIVASEESVASSATPTFSTAFRSSTNVLTANVTSFTLAAGANGQEKTLTFCQNATGGFTVAPPTNVHGLMSPVGTVLSKCSSQHFVYNSTQTAWIADGPGVKDE